MGDSITDRVSALQSEIGRGRRRIEKLESLLRDVHDVIASGTQPSEGLMGRIRENMSRGM